MTDEARARRIHAVYVDWAKARSKPFTAWDDLPLEKREKLIAAAHRLQSEYAAAGDAPSYGGVPMSAPPPCDSEIFERGTPIMLLHGPRSVLIEEWVKRLAAETQTRTDWHFAGGRAVVLVLGDETDIDKVRNAAERLWPDLLSAHSASGSDWVTRTEIEHNLIRRWL